MDVLGKNFLRSPGRYFFGAPEAGEAESSLEAAEINSELAPAHGAVERGALPITVLLEA